MTAIKREGNSLSPDTYLELFTFDTTAIGGAGPLYYTNSSIGGATSTNIVWQGNNYNFLPLDLTGLDNKADGTALSRPTLSVSNVHKTLMAGILALGDLVGTKVTRCRTFYKFTDNGTDSNVLAHYPLEVYYMTRKIVQNKHTLQYELSNALDRQGLKLPKRQVLRDKGFPGVSRVRVR